MVQPQPQHRYGSEHCVVELKRAGWNNSLSEHFL